MAGQVPYEIWYTDGTTGRESLLTSFISATFLSDSAAKTEAVATLQDKINKINSPGGDTITVKRGLVTPTQEHIRRRQREDRLDS